VGKEGDNIMRLRRTVYWVGGTNFEGVKTALGTNADAIILDVEDFVPPAQKDEARAAIFKMLTKWNFSGHERVVRINGWDTGLSYKDLHAVLPATVDAICLSKAESPKDLFELDAVLTAFEEKNSLPKNSIEIIPQIESPIGVMRCYDILASTDRITATTIGCGDLTAMMGLDRDIAIGSLQLIYAKQKILLEANAAGIHQIIDTPLVVPPGKTAKEIVDFLFEDSIAMRIMGFTGRGVMYPEHVDPTNKAFTPSAEEARYAKKVLESYRRAVKSGNPDLYVVEGRHIDPGKADKAERIAVLAELIEAKKTLKSY
jgi:citrate lyase subunit beta/citryl-CoA lyase